MSMTHSTNNTHTMDRRHYLPLTMEWIVFAWEGNFSLWILSENNSKVSFSVNPSDTYTGKTIIVNTQISKLIIRTSDESWLTFKDLYLFLHLFMMVISSVVIKILQPTSRAFMNETEGTSSKINRPFCVSGLSNLKWNDVDGELKKHRPIINVRAYLSLR